MANASIFHAIRTGSWLTGERLRAYSLIMLGLALAATVIWVALADGLIDRNGKPLGTDFSNVWSAGQMTLRGEAATAYDPVRHYAEQRAAFGGRDVPFYGWHYPPFFLAAAALLALLPYGVALALWMASTLGAYLAAMRAILQKTGLPGPGMQTALLTALAFPAVFVNLGHGQNGFLTAALLGGALVLMDARPLLAGLLIGLLAYKPQFGILIPLALAASGRWPAFMAAAATVLGGAVLSYLAFGAETWLAFFESTGLTREHVLEAGGTGWQKIQSLFAAARGWGASLETAYLLQGAVAALAAAALVWLWRSAAAFELKAAGLACASLLATPYVLDYDMMALAVALGFFAAYGLAHGFRNYEISVLALVWTAPLLARAVADATLVPLGFLALALLFGLIIRRAQADLAPLVDHNRSEHLAQA